MLQVVAIADLSLWVTFITMTQPFIFNNDAFFYPLFLFFVVQGALITVFEGYQLQSKDSLREYFSDPFNLVDIAKIGSMWIYIFHIIFGTTKGSHGLAAILNFFLFLKNF